MRRTNATDKSSSSFSSSSFPSSSSSALESSTSPSADSIIPKIFTAAPPTTLVSPRDTMLTYGMFQEDEDRYDEEESKTFKLQDPPKRKAKTFTKPLDMKDEFDCSPQKSSQDGTSSSPSRAKSQTSITQYMIRTSPQHGARLRSKSCQSPLPHSPYTILAQSPCTPSKCAKSNDGGNFFFSDLPTGELNTAVFSHDKRNRKRPVDMSSMNDKEIVENFTDLNMASPPPITVDKLPARERCRSSQDDSDYYTMANKSSAVTPPSPRLVKSACERRQKTAESPVYKDCFRRTSCRCYEENTSGGYSNRSFCKQANILEEESILCPTERSVFHGHESSQESRQQNMRFDQRPCPTAVFGHSLSGLVPVDYIHDPEHPIPDEFPYESTFVPSYDKKGIYRKDEMYNRIQALKEDSDAGKVMFRRWSNKDVTRNRSCDNQLWDSDLLPSPPSHNEVVHSPTMLPPLPPSPFNLHHTTPKISHLTSRHASTYISPVSKISPAGHAQSYRPSTSTGDLCLDRSSQPSEVRFEEGPGNSSHPHEYLATPLESPSRIRRKQPQLIPSPSNPFIFPSQQQQQKPKQQQYDTSHSTPVKSPAPPSQVPSSHSPASFHQSPCHIGCQHRGSPSSYGWAPGDLPCHQSRVHDCADRQRNGVAKRRLFCRQSEETKHSSTDGEASHCCHHFPDDHRLLYPESPSSSSSSGSQHRRSHYESSDAHFTFSGRSPSSQLQGPPLPPCNCCTGRCSVSHHPNSRCCLQRYHSTSAAYSQDDTYNI
ncbi:uncharacterized protein LOC115231760 isoform X2 [Octopus sinensis]|nr:uncharacterized protein LOC115231760 isoform X2 [Octopus sinensis]